ncbi:hypothetical protein [Streptomyces sp. NPDC051636]|uniref:hypothetical protein n=1 Tax=Streptomyces sp. NPDC051636 TaxID=3365663 RepID=UPI00379D16A0
MVGRVCGAAVGVVLAAAVSSCGTVSERRDDVRDTAVAFEKALSDGAYDRMCTVLSPGTVEEVQQSAHSTCAKALSQESLSPGGALRLVDVYGDQARAVLARDTLFLSRFTAGWKVVAAGCEQRPSQPYQCQIKSG